VQLNLFNHKKVSNKTSIQYDEAIHKCRSIFLTKSKDYGTSWRIMRVSSLMDQIFIKAQRIRTIEDNTVKKVNEDERTEFIGIVNYCIIALIQLELKDLSETNLPLTQLETLYNKQVVEVKALMEEKNHDYGEAWRDMRVSTFTDMILMRLLRIRQIEEAKGQTIMSEGIDANIRDMMNYAVFALIHLD
jgi:hypothetical protein